MSETTPAAKRGFGWRSLVPGASPWLLLSALIVALDQWTKNWASESLVYGRPNQINEYLDFTLLHNKGAAFSFLANAGGWQKPFFITLSSVVSVLLAVWLMRLPARGRYLLVLGLTFIIAGAVGNLIDRASLGYVVDFIHFHYEHRYWPAFNVADVAISVGAGFVILDAFVHKDEAPAAADESEAS